MLRLGSVLAFVKVRVDCIVHLPLELFKCIMRNDFRTLSEKITEDSRAVDEALKDLRTDIAQVDKQMMLDHTEVINLSAKVSDILEGQEGIWTEVVKKQVDKTLESVSKKY